MLWFSWNLMRRAFKLDDIISESQFQITVWFSVEIREIRNNCHENNSTWGFEIKTREFQHIKTLNIFLELFL